MRSHDRRPSFNRPSPMGGNRAPQPARRRRPAGPAVIAPSEPKSPAHRRQLIKAAYHRLAKLVAVPVAKLVAADADGLMSIVDGMGRVDGRQGDARRLAAKVVRLRNPAAPKPTGPAGPA